MNKIIKKIIIKCKNMYTTYYFQYNQLKQI